MNAPKLTTPDLVALSLLAERPMHGYELNQTLEYREVRDWAGISRPQVYYSLRKLSKMGLIEAVSSTETLGPERQTFATPPVGLEALARALGRPDCATQRPPPACLTWMALSTHAPSSTVRSQIQRRRDYLKEEITKERLTLAAITQDEGEMVVVARLMVVLTIRQFETELNWLQEVEAELV